MSLQLPVRPELAVFIQRSTAVHLAAGTLVRLVCTACGGHADLRSDNPNLDNFHCFCGDAPHRMVRS